MIEVLYRREVPYSQDVVLSQYFDFEHLEHVHPRSFGRARLVSKLGRVVVWELQCPAPWGALGLRSTFTQEYLPPWGIRSLIVRGFLRGTETTVDLEPAGEGTLVTEQHLVSVPDWRVYREWLKRTWVRRLDRIWEEDLAVSVCRGGWPGVPDSDAA